MYAFAFFFFITHVFTLGISITVMPCLFWFYSIIIFFLLVESISSDVLASKRRKMLRKRYLLKLAGYNFLLFRLSLVNNANAMNSSES